MNKPTGKNFIDLEGQKFGRLTVISFSGKSGRMSKWLCRCDCGVNTIAFASNLRSGAHTSCGCRRLERSIECATKHGHSRVSGASSVYRTWMAMINRCRNKRCDCYSRYGGRGITVCERWLKFEDFLEDMGERPKGMTIERIDNEKGYCKENCRWATMKEQQNNTRRNRFLVHGGERMTISQWSERLSIPYHTVQRRVSIGCSIGDIIDIYGCNFTKSKQHLPGE